MSNRKISLRNLLPLILLGFSLVLAIAQFLFGLTNNLANIGRKIEYPQHAEFPEFASALALAVKNEGVDYTKLKGSPLLASAVSKLACTSPNNIVDKKEQLCFWINAYNLLVLKEIADHYPIATVKQLGNSLTLPTHTVGGTVLSLQDIWMGKLMPLLSDQFPQALFLVSNGAVDDPPLNKELITNNNLEPLSESAVETFINKTENIKFDSKVKVIFLSPFFLWHKTIFEKQYENVYNFIASYLEPAKSRLLLDPRVPKSFAQNFNWSVNAVTSEEER